MTKIKICGITNLEDSQDAILYGADFIGFIFAKQSARRVEPSEAKKISTKFPPLCQTVGVFRDESIETIAQVLSQCRIDFVQLHGSESPEMCRAIDKPVIKAIEITSDTRASALQEEIERYRDCTEYLLFDKPKSSSGNSKSGSDDWMQTACALLKSLAGLHTLPPFFFAGGLTPDNVGAVVDGLKPFAIDVASGVELCPGKKDSSKVRDFCRSVKKHSALTEAPRS